MKININSIILLIGIVLGLIFPYYGLEASRYAIFALFFMMLFNMLLVDFTLIDIVRFKKRDFHILFFTFIFIPILFLGVTNFIGLNENIRLGIFMTLLAPLAIVTPLFLKDPQKKLQAIKLVFWSTFLFPLYFILLMKLFFSSYISSDIIKLFRDLVLVTIIPLVISIVLNRFGFIREFKRKLVKINFLILVNMLLIGFLCFVYTGNAFLRNNLDLLSTKDILTYLLLAIFQEFLIFKFSSFFEFDSDESIILSIKNVAITGVISIMFFPKTIILVLVILSLRTFLFLIMENENIKQKFLEFSKTRF